MRRMPWAMNLWPGLPQLWCSGYWTGLALASGFAAMLNVLLVASLVWVELFRPLDLRLGWGLMAAMWLVSVLVSLWRGSRGPAARRATSAEVLFRDALSEYLQGDWFEAESTLARLLHLHPRDVEGRLLLATLLRHTRRYDEALDQLARVELLRDSAGWAQEIAAEKRYVADGQAEAAANQAQPFEGLLNEDLKQAA
jgi:hypothetical protein